MGFSEFANPTTEIINDQQNQTNSNTESNDEYLKYPKVKELLVKASNELSQNKKVKFNCTSWQFHLPFAADKIIDSSRKQSWTEALWQSICKPILLSNAESSINYSGSLAKALERTAQHDEMRNLMANQYLASSGTHFHTLINRQIGGMKVLGDFNLAYIEAKASKEYKEWQNLQQTIDHFVCPDGICNLEIFGNVLKAQEIPKDELVVLLMPENAIKAIRYNKLERWQELRRVREKASYANGKIYEYNKEGKIEHSLDLVQYRAELLKFPIYKVKAGDYWAVVLPVRIPITSESNEQFAKSSFAKRHQHEDGDIQSIAENITLKLNHITAETLSNELSFDQKILESSSDSITCTVGQAARVIFQILGGYKNIPEAMLYPDGGSFSSIVTEKSSDGRHLGINNMHDVLKHKWHLNSEVAIPWNYISFDSLSEKNQHLLEDENVFLLSPCSDENVPFNEKPMYLEAAQAWKKSSYELFNYMCKTIYKEFAQVANRKYHINIKVLVDLIAKYLARAALYDHDENSQLYKQEIEELGIPAGVKKYLRLVSYIHYAACSSSDYHSCKTHPFSMTRLQWLARVHKELRELQPDYLKKFETRVNEILASDIKSEFTILADLYYSELNKIT